MSTDLLDAPATDIASHAHDLLLSACDPHLVGHCERSYRFALLLADDDAPELDVEALYVAVMLHDLGLSSRYEGDERFEVRGANVARSLVRDHGWTGERAAHVWDIAALHTSTGLAAHRSPEARYANLGISLDIRGSRQIGDEPDIRRVLDRWPRATFPDLMEASLLAEVRARPETTRSTWMEHIAVAHVEGYTPRDFLASLRASTTFV